MDQSLDTTPTAAERSDLQAVVTATPASMFSDKALPDKLFAVIEAEIAAFVPDLSTGKSRGDIAALAYKVARTKTAVDAAGKELGEEARKVLDGINGERRTFKDRFEALQVKARKPLDDWEEAEAARVAKVEELLTGLRAAGVIALGEKAKAVRVRYEALKVMELDPLVLQDHETIAKDLRTSALATLEAGYATLVKAEADAARLAELEKADKDRLKREADEAAAAEAARLSGERAEAAAREAAERDDVLREAERKRLEAEQAETAAREQRERDARAADEAHRNKVLHEAAQALVLNHKIAERTALAILASIAAGNVPHVKLEF